MLGKLQSKHFDRWLGGYVRHQLRRTVEPRAVGTRHVLFAFCDHFEPLWGHPSHRTALERVHAWETGYRALAENFSDADGRPPQHTFFFPGEEYRPEFFDALEPLIRSGLGEVELHLHHDGATEHSARREIENYLATYAERGHLARGPRGQLRYAFIHGNWALANARPDGRWCGVDSELSVLFETGCYADFTFPAVPDVSQPNRVNEIYWPVGDVSRRRAYEHGERAAVGHSYEDRILMLTGPLGLSLRENGWSPRLEYGAITAKDPGSRARVRAWLASNIHVAGCPEWVFIKVHTHGAPEAQAASLLGEGGLQLHRALCAEVAALGNAKLHYVTAREMFNLAKAAMAGKSGDPNPYRDYVLGPPPIRRTHP
ncbi:MAG: hypothetical protein SFV15_04115 [Polyangiaceae bacterium]|nr:hypothetical protein [Polyangiaceae bacterium]